MRITRRLVTHCKMVLFHTKDVIDFCYRRYVKSGELSVVHNAHFCRCKVLGDSESKRNGTRNINSIYYVYSKHFADGFLILSMIFFFYFPLLPSSYGISKPIIQNVQILNHVTPIAIAKQYNITCRMALCLHMLPFMKCALCLREGVQRHSAMRHATYNSRIDSIQRQRSLVVCGAVSVASRSCWWHHTRIVWPRSSVSGRYTQELHCQTRFDQYGWNLYSEMHIVFCKH